LREEGEASLIYTSQQKIYILSKKKTNWKIYIYPYQKKDLYISYIFCN
jgi:hypothetical protein